MFMVESSNLVNVNGPVKTGECVYTSSGKLQANGIKYVIHTVGPVYEKKSALFYSGQLYNSIYNALAMANKLGCNSIAFPAISSGIYAFPKPLCAQVFFCAIKDFVIADSEHTINGRVFLQTIRLTNYDDETAGVFKREFDCFCRDQQSALETNMLYEEPTPGGRYQEKSNWQPANKGKDIFTKSEVFPQDNYKPKMPGDLLSAQD